ncbi:MAG: histidine kinase [Flavicella sp.]
MKTIRAIFLFFFCVSVVAQQSPFLHHTDKNILPNNTVRAVLFSKAGGLWVGTDNGLVCKQNENVAHYFIEDGLALNNTWALAEDSSQNIWVGSYGGGLSRFDGTSWEVFSTDDGLVHNEITSLSVFNDVLYVGSSDGISVISLPRGSNEQLQLCSYQSESLSSFRVQDFYSYDGVVYVVTYNKGIHKVLFDGLKIQLEAVVSDEIFYASMVQGDSLLLGQKEFCKKISLKALKLQKALKETSQSESSIFWDFTNADGRLFGAAWGIYEKSGGVYEFENGKITFVNQDFGINSSSVSCLAYDSNYKKLFVGTLDNGLYEVDLDPIILFEKKQLSPIDYAYIASERVLATVTKKGLSIGAHFIRAKDFKSQQKKWFDVSTNKKPKKEDYFYELIEDTKASAIVFYGVKAFKNNFWVNTSVGLFQLSNQGLFLNYYPLHTLAFNFTPKGELIETHPYHGVRVYSDLDKLKYTYFSENDTATPTDVVGSLFVGGKTYFTSVFKGLFVYDNSGFRSFDSEGIWNEKKLRHITDYKDGIAVSNEEGDLYVFSNEIGGDFQEITKEKILGNTISFIENYKEYLIIGTEKGLTITDTKKFRYLNREQGLKKKLNTAIVIDKTLHIGSSFGSYTVNLDSLLNQGNYLQKVSIAHFKVNDQSREVCHDMDALNYIEKDSRLYFRFEVNAHPYPKKIKYGYRLNPSEAWKPLESNYISLNYLKPSTYLLEVQVEDLYTGQVFSENLMQFIIPEPFYKQFWFFVLCLITSVFGTIIVLGKIRRIKAKREREKEIVKRRLAEIKLEALLSQMNPHFIFNALNSIQYFVQTEKNSLALKYLTEFSKLMRANLNNSGKQYISLHEEIEYLKTYASIENTRVNQRVSIVFDKASDLDEYEVEIPPMILQPFVENSFVHAFNSSIENPILEISFFKNDAATFTCQVKDNGLGRASNNLKSTHVSKGLSLVEERLSFLGYDPKTCLDVNIHEEGTTVTITFLV